MRRVILAAVACTALACGGLESPANVDVSGTWALQSISGATLPAVISQNSSIKDEVVSDVFAFYTTGNLVETIVHRLTPAAGSPTDQSASIEGSYSVKGNVLTVTVFTYPDLAGYSETATVRNGAFTISQGSVNRVYTRR